MKRIFLALALLLALGCQFGWAQIIPPLVRTVGGSDSTFGLGHTVTTDSMFYVFPRAASGSYPVVEGNLSVYFKTTTVAGATDSLSVWMKTLRRVTGSTFAICDNDSFKLFDELDWTSGNYYCWPDQNSDPISYGPCDGVVIIWRFLGAGASDSLRIVPRITVK
jgi:hypothetical protein